MGTLDQAHMGCISHLHTTPTLLQLLCKPHCVGLALPPAPRQAPCCRGGWGRAEAQPGWSLFLPLEITGHYKSGHISVLSFP